MRWKIYYYFMITKKRKAYKKGVAIKKGGKMTQDLETMLNKGKFSRFIHKIKNKALASTLSALLPVFGALFAEKPVYAQASNNSSYELVFPQFADGGNANIGIYKTVGKIVNPNKKPAKLNYFFRNNGDGVSVSINGNVSSTFNQEIAAGGSYTFTTDGVGNGNGIIQNGSLKLTSDIPVYATITYEYNNGSRINRVSLPPAEKLQKHQLYVENSNTYRTGFAVDYEGEPTTIIHEIYSEGALKTSKSIAVNGAKHYAMFNDELFKEFFQANPDFKGTHIIKTGNNKPLAVANLRLKNGSSYSSLVSTQGSNTLYFPQIVNGAGYTLEMILQNLENFSQNVTVNFFKQDGSPNNFPPEAYAVTLAPNGVHRFTTTGRGEINVGWGTAKSSNLEGRITGTAVYDFDNNQVSVSHSAPNTEHGMSAIINNNKMTGLAIVNPTDKYAELTLIAVDNSGKESGRKSFVLAPKTQSAKFIQEFLEGLQKNFQGSFYVISENHVPVSLTQLDLSVDEMKNNFNVSYSNAAAFNVGYDTTRNRVGMHAKDVFGNPLGGLTTFVLGDLVATTSNSSATFFVAPNTKGEAYFVNNNIFLTDNGKSPKWMYIRNKNGGNYRDNIGQIDIETRDNNFTINGDTEFHMGGINSFKEYLAERIGRIMTPNDMTWQLDVLRKGLHKYESETINYAIVIEDGVVPDNGVIERIVNEANFLSKNTEYVYNRVSFVPPEREARYIIKNNGGAFNYAHAPGLSTEVQWMWTSFSPLMQSPDIYREELWEPPFNGTNPPNEGVAQPAASRHVIFDNKLEFNWYGKLLNAIKKNFKGGTRFLKK